jgi:hypothetical protein
MQSMPSGKARKANDILSPRFHRAVRAAAALTLAEREKLIDTLKTQLIERRKQLIEDVKRAKAEIKGGQGIAGTAREILKVLEG